MNENQEKTKELENLIYLLSKIQKQLYRHIYTSNGRLYSENELKQINEDLKSINLSFNDAIKVLKLLKNSMSEPLFEENQISCIETALLDSGVGITEISAVLIHLKNAKKDIEK